MEDLVAQLAVAAEEQGNHLAGLAKAEIERLRAVISDHRDSVVGRVITIDRANGLLWQAVE